MDEKILCKRIQQHFKCLQIAMIVLAEVKLFIKAVIALDESQFSGGSK